MKYYIATTQSKEKDVTSIVSDAPSLKPPVRLSFQVYLTPEASV